MTSKGVLVDLEGKWRHLYISLVTLILSIGVVAPAEFAKATTKTTVNNHSWALLQGNDRASSINVSSDSVDSLAFDHGLVVAGTKYNGVIEYKKGKWVQLGSTPLQTSSTDPNGEFDSGITIAVNPTNGYIVAGTQGDGVFVWNGEKWNQLGSNNGYLESAQSAIGYPLSAMVNTVAVSANGTIVAGTGGAGVFEWNGSSWIQLGGNLIVSQQHIEIINSLTFNPKNGDVIAGTSGGVFDWNGSTWTQLGGNNGFLQTSLNDPNQQSSLIVNAVSADPINGEIIAGTQGDGVFAWNGSSWCQIGGNNGILQTSYRDPNHSYSSDVLSVTVNGKNGEIVAGTHKDGVFIWNGKSWDSIDNHDGLLQKLPPNSVISPSDISAVIVNNTTGTIDAGLSLASGFSMEEGVWTYTPDNNTNTNVVYTLTTTSQAQTNNNKPTTNTTTSPETNQILNSQWTPIGGNSGDQVTNGIDPSFLAFVYSMATLPNGNIVIGTNYGVYEKNGSLWIKLGNRILQPSSDDPNRLASSSVFSLAIEPNGNILAGTAGDGVFEWNGSRWTQLGGDYLNNDKQDPNQSVSSYVNTLTFDPINGEILAGIGGMMGAGDGAFVWTGSKWVPIGGNYSPKSKNPLQGSFVNSILVLSSGAIEFGTAENIVELSGNKWSIPSNSLQKKYPFTYRSPLEANVAQLPDGNIIAGTEFGVFEWDSKAWTELGTKYLQRSVSDVNQLNSSSIIGIAISKSGTILAGTLGDGVFEWVGTQWVQMGGDQGELQPNAEQYFNSDSADIRSLAIDPVNGEVYAGTQGDGVFIQRIIPPNEK